MVLYFNTDNTRPRAAHHTIQLLANNNGQSLPWFLMSPGLNPIQHVWVNLDKRVRGRVTAPANVRELFQALQQEWVAIQAEVSHNLIQSQPKRH